MEQHDEVSGTVGDDSKNIAIGKDINQDARETSATGNVVNFYNAQPKTGSGQSRRVASSKSGISMAEANALWESINRLSEAVGGLKASIELNSRETNRLALTLEERERMQAERERLQAEQIRIIDKTIHTIQTGLAELGLTPKSQREPKWKTNVLVGSTAIIAVCVFLGLLYLMFGGG